MKSASLALNCQPAGEQIEIGGIGRLARDETDTAWTVARCPCKLRDSRVDLSIVIPAWNEQRRIAPAVDAIVGELQGLGLDYEVVCVDDGSSDTTADLIDGYARRNPRVRLLRLPAHRGKGAAVRTGVLDTRARWCSFSTRPFGAAVTIGVALPLLCEGGADIVRARALQRRARRAPAGCVRRVLGSLFLALARTWTDPAATDLTCGFKGIAARPRWLSTAVPAGRLGVRRRDGVAGAVAGLRDTGTPVEWRHDPDSRVRLPAAVLASSSNWGGWLGADAQSFAVSAGSPRGNAGATLGLSTASATPARPCSPATGCWQP